jgi:hypothetical protein
MKANPKALQGAFKSGRASAWTPERLAELGRDDLVNLQANAQRLGEEELASLCGQRLEQLPRRGPASSGARARDKSRQPLLPRTKAFAALGVWLRDPRTSWSGVRKGDGVVVMAMWHGAVQSRDGGCYCLLWAPNVDGARPWSDTAAGRERLDHCKLAAERGAQGLLVQGEALEGRLPEERARTVFGIDATAVIPMQVEMQGAEYWASWGKKAPTALS